MNKTVEKIKKIGCSPIYLLATIAFTLSAVLTFVGTFSVAESIKSSVTSLLNSSESLAQFAGELGGIFAALPIGNLSVGVISLIVSMGMWMTYGSCRSSKNPVATSGMTIIKIVKVIELIGIILTAIFALIVAVTVGFAISTVITEAFNADPTIFLIVGISIVAVLVIMFILTIIYYSGIFRTIKAVKMTLNTGVIMGKVSVSVIVFNYFIAAGTLFVAVVSPDIIVLATGLCSAVSLVLSSVALGTLRSEMLYISSKGSSALNN